MSPLRPTLEQAAERLRELSRDIGTVMSVAERRTINPPADQPQMLAMLQQWRDRLHEAEAALLAADTPSEPPQEPTDGEVNAAIDALAEKAKRSVRGTSGNAWGQEAEVDRLAALLKSAVADPIGAEAGAPPELEQLQAVIAERDRWEQEAGRVQNLLNRMAEAGAPPAQSEMLVQLAKRIIAAEDQEALIQIAAELIALAAAPRPSGWQDGGQQGPRLATHGHRWGTPYDDGYATCACGAREDSAAACLPCPQLPEAPADAS